MNQKELLTTTRLTLAPHLKEGPEDEGVIPLKNVPYKTYLTISPKQWSVLKRFRTGTSVTELIPELIIDRKCPSLSSLYELVLKAYQSGILVSDTPHTQIENRAIKASKWPLQVSERTIRPLAYLATISGIGAVLYQGIDLPQTTPQLLFGWLVATLCLSLGNLLAASLLRWCDAEIYRPHLNWRTLIPHFSFDRSDLVMVERVHRRLFAVVRMAPLLFGLGLTAIFAPELTYPLLLGLLYSSDPISENPVTDFLRACYKELRLSTAGDFLFVQNRLFWTMVNRKIKLQNKRFYLVYALYTFSWLLLVHTLHARLFEIQGVELVYALYSSPHFPIVSMAILILLGGMMLLAAGAGLWLLSKNIQTIFDKRPRRKEITTEHSDSLSSQQKEEILDSTLLFQKAQLEHGVIQAIAQRAPALAFQKGQTIIREGDDGDSLYVIASGEVEVQKETPSGRPSVVARLGSLEAFGEIALLRRVPRTRSIVARTQTILLEISRDDFQRHLVGEIGADLIEATLEKEAFLARLEFTSSWPPQALRRFAELSTECTVRAGERFLRKGHDNRFFYLVYEGAFEVKTDGKRLAKLGIGDFFGEISLLQNSIITADVYAIEDSRCFVLYKSDFLQFISEDFILSLFFERISSKRLNEPIFPLRGRSFDCITVR